VPWKQAAVLFRTNLQSRALEIALRQASVRYNLIGGQSYFDRREIRDVLAYLKTMVNPHDDVSLLRIANVPARGLTDATMEKLLAVSHERHCSVFTAMKHTDVQAMFSSRTQDAIATFVALIENTRAELEAGSMPNLAGWAEQFLATVGYIDDLRRSEKNTETADNRVRNVKELLAEFAEWTPGQAAIEYISELLSELTLDAERDEEKENEMDAVTLITMHSCKGLEFPHVFIVGLEQGLLPHSRSAVENTLDEERRLFYVAITRAMQTLTMSYCLSRKKYGQALPCHPSQFLQEIPQEFIEHADQKGKTVVAPTSGKGLFSMMREIVG
jgi:DNA helicase II / ATP-dependent DNA helicase PcrA